MIITIAKTDDYLVELECDEGDEAKVYLTVGNGKKYAPTDLECLKFFKKFSELDDLGIYDFRELFDLYRDKEQKMMYEFGEYQKYLTAEVYPALVKKIKSLCYNYCEYRTEAEYYMIVYLSMIYPETKKRGYWHGRVAKRLVLHFMYDQQMSPEEALAYIDKCYIPDECLNRCFK